MSFKVALSEKLIDCVKGYPALYNTDLKEYSDIGLKMLLWRRVAEKCNMISGDEARKQWKNLRDGYRCSIKSLKSGKKSNWKFFEEMSFVRPYMKNRQSNANLTSDENESQITGIGIDEVCLKNVEDDMDSQMSENCTSIIKLENSMPPKRIRTLSTNAIHDQVDFFGEQAINHEEQIKDEQQWQPDVTQIQSEDSLKLFFDSMYASTKKLAPPLQRMVKSKLFQAVTEAEVAAESLSKI